jgi:hypothetical protein
VARIGRFAYFERLSPRDKAIYERSDAASAIPLPDPAPLRELASRVEAALATGKRARVASASTALATAMMAQLGVVGPKIHVREVRPQLDDGELHGLYTFSHEGKPPKLEVWMRTAAQGNVVRFRTFLRTLVHELVHHLDIVLLALEESFHTEGFFRRESSLVRQLAPRPRKTKVEPKAKKGRAAKKKRRPFVQLELF